MNNTAPQQTITVAIYGGQAPAVFGHELQLDADATDTRIDGARADTGPGFPDHIVDVIARQDAPDVAQEQRCQFEVLGGKPDPNVIAQEQAFPVVDAKFRDLDLR